MAPGPITVFAPNDDAFVAVIKTLGVTKLELMALPNLGEILKGHVVRGPETQRHKPAWADSPAQVAGKYLSTDLTEGQELTTLSGKKLKISLAGGASVNGTAITKADIKVDNGVIHAVKAVLL